MNHPPLMREFESAGRLEDVADRDLGIDLAGLSQHVVERPARHEFHAEVIGSLVLAEIMDLDDVVMRELSGGVGFANEAGDERGVLRPLGPHGFEGDLAIERKLTSQVDSTHAAAAQNLLDLIAAERRGNVGTYDNIRLSMHIRSRFTLSGASPDRKSSIDPFGRRQRWRRNG